MEHVGIDIPKIWKLVSIQVFPTENTYAESQKDPVFYLVGNHLTVLLSINSIGNSGDYNWQWK